ncbi:MAG: PEP-CTERM sorting domain-containing protein, partial [Planctomycetota bacterium]
EREASLDPGEFVLAGHGSPAANPWEQTWYVDVTGSVAADLTFDVSGGFSGPTADMFRLLYNATDPLALSNLAISPLVNGGQVAFALAESQLLSGYYALYVVPEPSTSVLLALGILAMGGLGRRRLRRLART